jgi:ribosome biogenesis protein NSA2
LIILFRAKLYNKRRQNEKIQMKKTIKSHQEKETKQRQEVPEGALPPYLLDREKQSRAKILSNTIKQKRKEKAVKYSIKIFRFIKHYDSV